MKEEIIYWSSENKNPILNIDLAGISYCDGSYEIKRKKSDTYVLEYVLQGTGSIIHNGVIFTASKGDFYVLKKGDCHHYYSSKENPWIKIWMNLNGTLIEHLLEVYPLEHIIYPSSNQILELFKDFHSLLVSQKNSHSLPQACTNLLHQIISSVYFATQPTNPSLSVDAFVIKNYLEEHIFSSVTLSELSRLIYKSEAQVIRLFKKAYGITPYAYLLNIKIEYAKTLLIHTNVPIKEIALRLHFADEHYFSNFFKQCENVSPSQYRNNH